MKTLSYEDISLYEVSNDDSKPYCPGARTIEWDGRHSGK